METWSKRKKILFLLAAFWSAWSLLRSSTDFEILDLSFWQWEQKDKILLNWFGPIFGGWLLVICYDWVMKDNTDPALPIIVDPEMEKSKMEELHKLFQDFEQELAKWPEGQAKIAREIIATTSKGNYANFDRLGTELAPKQYMKVLGVVKSKELIQK